MAAYRTVGVSFGVSLGVHALLLGMLVTTFSRAAVHAPLVVQRVRLVYVDPAPAAPPRAAAAAPAVPAPVAVPKPQPVPAPKPRVIAKAVKPEAPKPAPLAPAPEVAAPAAPANDAPPAPAAVEGRGDTPGGSAGDGGQGTGSGPYRIGDVATAPVLVTRVVPEYPRHARLAEIEGEVLLEVIVDRSGRVTDAVRVLATVPELERAAIAAVRRWRFRPARDRAGSAVAVLMEIPVRFVLREATVSASH